MTFDLDSREADEKAAAIFGLAEDGYGLEDIAVKLGITVLYVRALVQAYELWPSAWGDLDPPSVQ